MKKFLTLFLFVCSLSASAQFSGYFEPRTMRFDYSHCGDATQECFYFNKIVSEPYWAGGSTSLIDSTGYGVQLFKVIDARSGKLIYSRSFSTLFNEWQTTVEAATVSKCFAESVVFPFPLQPVVLEIYSRGRDGKFVKKFGQNIDPSDYNIVKKTSTLSSFEVYYRGNSSKRVDIVLLSEGYSQGQEAMFRADCDFFATSFFSFSPYKENKDKFNIRAVWAPSKDQGVTLPGEHVWRSTALDAKFYTFGLERYQMVADLQRVRDIAGNVPYDYIYILSNTQKYGGGGIYNFYGISSANTLPATAKVYIHEFGHLFLGLGDEYVGGTTTVGMYNLNVEPWVENLTTLKDFKNKAWSKIIDPKTPIPTPVLPKFEGLVGVYEGGGYEGKGVYRPYINCLMNNFSADEFCPVCSAAIQKMIDNLTK